MRLEFNAKLICHKCENTIDTSFIMVVDVGDKPCGVYLKELPKGWQYHIEGYSEFNKIMCSKCSKEEVQK